MADKTAQRNLYRAPSPFWCRVKEVALGEVSNWNIKRYDYELAEKYRPDQRAFSQYDVMQCDSIDKLPDDWRALAYACIEKYNIKPNGIEVTS